MKINKLSPYLKWIVGFIGLFMAIHQSKSISNVYIERYVAQYQVEFGIDPDGPKCEEIRSTSLGEAGKHLFILMFGVMASRA